MKRILLILGLTFIPLSLLVLKRTAKEQGMVTETRYAEVATLGDTAAEVPSNALEPGVIDAVKESDISAQNLSTALDEAVRRKDTEEALQIVRKIMEERRKGTASANSMAEETFSYHDD